MHQRVLDIEVVLVVEDRGLLISARWALGLIASIWGDGYGLEINLLIFCGCHICDSAYAAVMKENN